MIVHGQGFGTALTIPGHPWWVASGDTMSKPGIEGSNPSLAIPAATEDC